MKPVQLYFYTRPSSLSIVAAANLDAVHQRSTEGAAT